MRLAERIIGRKDADAGKLPPALVLYYPPKLVGEATGARCGTCAMFFEKDGAGRCTVVRGPIDGVRGVCGLFVLGEHAGPDAEGRTPKDVAGYIEDGPTHCASCAYFVKPHACRKVAGKVDAAGCCNGWERK